ncbi:hypothetical protein MWU60_08895 [Yoonia sp. F2084L]|nr:hypothetical protein [Yoonia sp. F2084L]
MLAFDQVVKTTLTEGVYQSSFPLGLQADATKAGKTGHAALLTPEI